MLTLLSIILGLLALVGLLYSYRMRESLRILPQLARAYLLQRHGSSPVVTVHDNYLSIKYEYAYNNYELVVPYNDSAVVPMTQQLIEIHTPQGYRVLHQPPGVPLLVEPQALGGRVYRVTNLETDEITLLSRASDHKEIWTLLNSEAT